MGKQEPPANPDEPSENRQLMPVVPLLAHLPLPTAQFRLRAWREFQRALDPLAPPRRLPPPRRH